MGMYDTIRFDEPRECPNCGAKIESVQTKKFEKILNTYEVGDRIAHAEETRISGEDTYSRLCWKGPSAVIVVVLPKIT